METTGAPRQAPTDAKRPVGVISLIGSFREPHPFCAILAKKQPLASLENADAENEHKQHSEQHIGRIGVDIADMHPAGDVTQCA